MPSTLTWIDHDTEARDRMQRVLALFEKRDTRDELGLGAVRDSFSDFLFPGTVYAATMATTGRVASTTSRWAPRRAPARSRSAAPPPRR